MGTVADQLAKRLREGGVRFVFGVPSGSWIQYMEAFRKEGIEFVLVSNEASGGFMAEVCAQLTGTPAACYGTVGPGATNLTTGVIGALLDRQPMIALSSEPPEKMIGRTVQMAVDQQAMFAPLTKWTTRLAVTRVDQIVDQALRIAVSETPGPVHIGLPEDIGSMEAVSASPAALPISAQTPAAPCEAALLAMEAAFAKARKPVLAVGLTAVRSKAGPIIAAIAERHHMPIIITPMAKGIVQESHPWYAGVLFHALSDRVAETHRDADLVIAAGYDPVEFNFEDWMPRVPLLNLNTTEADIDRGVYRDVLDVVGDLNASLRRLSEIPAARSDWDGEALAARMRKMFDDLAPPPGTFGPRAALAILREILPQDGIMACDVGAHTHLIGQAWRTPEPGLQIMTNGCSSMGFGVPAAIAAKLSRPDKKVACVTGDGGFLMSAGEMAVARRKKLGIVFVVLADQKLELIRLKQDKKGMPNFSTILHEEDCPTPNYVFGVPVVRADNAEEYRRALQDAFAAEGPVIIEARIDPSEYSQLILRKHK